MDGESENADATRRSRWRFVEEGAFFWLLFFAPAKKSNSPAGESSWPPAGRCVLIFHQGDQDQDRFALSREFISFAGPKETNQRKGPSPTRRNSDRLAGRNFPTRHPWLDRKTAAIHGGRPPGLRSLSAANTGKYS